QAPAWLQKLCEAWAGGINYYLQKNPQVKPALLTKFEPWMTMYFTEGSIGGDIERVSTRRIKAFYEGSQEIALNEEGNGLVLDDPFDEPKGSNGFAISGDLTKSGNSMLLINPHTSFYFRGEYHAVSEEGLNAYGAITWGQFFIYQGFNEKTGWMHTSTYTDVIDEFAEDVKKVNGQLVYQYGDEQRPVETKEVKLLFKSDTGLQEKEFSIFRTHHGPITHIAGDRWVATALMWKPVEALTQSYTRTKLNNHDEFREMMNIKTNSSNNTVYADASGNIAYYHGNFVPKRDVQFDYTKPVDGSNPATDWQGLHPVEEAITLLNPANGWIQNCNSTPFTAAGDYSPKKEDYPNYMSRAPENFRGVQARAILDTTKDYTLDKLIQIAYDPYLPAFEKVVPGLVAAYDANRRKNKDLKDPVEVLRNWEMKTGRESVGMTLAHYYGMALRRSKQVPSEVKGMNRFHYYGVGLPANERLEVFRTAVGE
ncbi:MAG: penicillin acylase family protein, partial [Bacteroidota bacterium]